MSETPAVGPEAGRGGGSGWRWVVAAIVLAAAVPRVLGLHTELWMDELLSARLVADLGSPLGVFTAIHHDNNHYLNSLWIHAVGPGAAPWTLRLPPVVLGTALVGLAAVAVADAGRRASLCAALLVGFSYPLIHYSSEARGYAYVLFFALLSYLTFRRFVTGREKRWAVACALSVTLAFLAHLGFATTFAALAVWAIAEPAAAPGHRVRRLAANAAVLALPVLALAALFAVDLRWMRVLGAPPLGTLESWLGALGLFAGGARWWVALPIAGLAVAAVGLELRRLCPARWPEVLFFVCTFLFPLVNALVAEHAYPRYYLTSLLFALLLLARWLGRLTGEAGLRKRIASVLLAAILTVNAYRTVRFLAEGRGGYREALAWMLAVEGEDRVTVAGDRDAGHILAIDYYGSRMPDRSTFEYSCSELRNPGCERLRPSRDAGQDPTDFFLMSWLDDSVEPRDRIVIRDMAEYELSGVFPKYGLSGLTLAVYRLAP